MNNSQININKIILHSEKDIVYTFWKTIGDNLKYPVWYRVSANTYNSINKTVWYSIAFSIQNFINPQEL